MTDRARPAIRRRRRLTLLAAAAVVALLLVSAPWVWTEMSAHGHVYDEAKAPAADVVIVLGTEVAADRRRPAARLAGRLETAAELVHSGRARVILVSGDIDGVTARCDGCAATLLAGKAVRDYFASGKAAWDAVRRRPPAVHSPESPAVQDALRVS